MPSAVLDTSVIVRFLTQDDREKAAAVHALLHRAEEGSLLLPDVALSEVAFVLLRVYRWPSDQVASAMRAIVTHRAIEVPGRELWLDIADDIQRGRGPVDSYLIRMAERAGITTVLTFDENMRPLAHVQCVAP